MKRLFTILFALMFALSLEAQSNQKEESISSAGGYSDGGSISVSWTLGDAIVPYAVSEDGSSLMLTPSLQPTLFVTALEEIIDSFIDVTIYPNPTSEMVRVGFSEPIEQEIDLFLFDGQGKLVYRDVIEVGVFEEVVDMQQYSVGLYMMRLVQGNLANVYKIVKQ